MLSASTPRELLLPRHVAIIPDGNRRWAASRGVGAMEGHQNGAQAVRAVAEHAAERGIEFLSLWGLSLDNFSKRNTREVAGLLALFREEFTKLATSEYIHKQRVKIHVLGRWQEKFPSPVSRAIEAAVKATEGYEELNLIFLLAYSGIDDMQQAVTSIVRKAEGKELQSVEVSTIKQHLMTRNLPPVDLLLRTGGEPHLSAGFMMWDVADAQLYFTPTFWPDFSSTHLDAALTEYARRQRRFGT